MQLRQCDDRAETVGQRVVALEEVRRLAVGQTLDEIALPRWPRRVEPVIANCSQVDSNSRIEPSPANRSRRT